jgi:paraquat-inducible protein A
MAIQNNEEYIACHECDQLYRVEPLEEGARASCRHCGALLYTNIPDSLNRCLALYLAALMLFLIANCFPFLTLKLGGRVEENILLSGGWALYELGMADLGILIFFTSAGFPALAILGMLYLLIPARYGRLPPGMGMVYRLVNAITPWSLVSVFMLGVLIAFVKLQDIATVTAGTSVYALAVLLVVYSAARANFDPRALWALSPIAQAAPEELSAPASRILNCHTCGMLHVEAPGLRHCRRCGSGLHHRIQDSISKTWALLLSAAILLIPANVYPVMTVIRFGQGEPNTILSGIMHLIEDGMWGLGMIVFVASIVVPILKLILLTFLLVSIQRKSDWRPRDRTVLYRITEVVGAWSMVDIFLVGLLTALVSLDALSTIRPGIGATFFGAVVVITMFAARSFDPRLIWDNLETGAAPEPK